MAQTIKEVLVTAEVTDCMSGETSGSSCMLALLESKNSGYLVTASTRGCFTGFESFAVTKQTVLEGFPNGWLACAGRKGEYDTLFIPPGEMSRALQQLDLSTILD